MATSLFKMPFDPDRLKLTRVYESPELAHCQVETMSCEKIREIYGDLKFLELHEDRPCTYTSLVTSIDGRIAFTDAPPGAPDRQEEQVRPRRRRRRLVHSQHAPGRV